MPSLLQVLGRNLEGVVNAAMGFKAKTRYSYVMFSYVAALFCNNCSGAGPQP
jgi:hypothetical protein